MNLFFDRVAVNTDTTGTGSCNIGAAITTAFLTPAQAGAVNLDSPIPYLLTEGADFEIGYGTFNDAAPDTFARDTVVVSKIAGTVGTTKMTLGGNAILRFIVDATSLSEAFDMAKMIENTDAKVMTAAERTKLAAIEAGADVTDADNIGSIINAATGKTTPIDADTFPITDTAASNVLKKVTWANIKATLKTYFDTLYQPLASVLTNTTASFTTAQETKLGGIETAADVTDAGNVGSSIFGATAKTTLVDADTMPLTDSAAADALKKITWANVKVVLGALYQPLATVLTNTTAAFTTAQETKLSGIEALADVTDAGNIAPAIFGATDKATPVNADTFGITDSAASNVLKKLTWANVKVALNLLYQPLNAVLTATTASFTTADETKLDAIEALADVTDAGNVGSSIWSATAKTTPLDADTVAINDTAASNVLKKVTWTNVKAFLKTYFDTLYQVTDADLTSIAALTTTAHGRSFLDRANAAASRTLAGVDVLTFCVTLPGTLDNYSTAFTVILDCPYAFTLNSIDAVVIAGAVTLNVRKNGTSVTSLSAVSVTTTPANTAATGANTFVAGDKLDILLTNNISSDTHFSLVINCTRT